MRFTSPLFLLLLLLVPVAAWMGWPASGPARRREITSLTLRLIIIVCLVFSLAGAEIVRGGNNLAVVFLVDVSDSMPQEAVDAEVEYVRDALEEMRPEDQAAVVLFGGDALVERSMSAGRELSAFTSTPVTNQTDLAGAVQLGLALFPSGYAKRMVLLSDGAQTTGDVLEAAKFASVSDVEIAVLPFVNRSGAEATIRSVNVPTQLRPGEQFDLDVTVNANEPTRSVVRVLAGDEILYEGMHELHRGIQTLTLPLEAGQPGFVGYQVQIVPVQDGFYQNNEMHAFSQVEGPPRILMITVPSGEDVGRGQLRADEHSAILQVLQAAGFRVDVSAPSRLPADLPTLAQYDSIVMVNVPARMLNGNQLENVQAYVRDLGGGLVVVGGPTSYGVGGYFRTPLEDMLPVEMQIKDEQRRPSLGIVFVIDHSGSMADTSGGVQKLELAKEAAARSVELLFPSDRIGVIAFDDIASWVVPMTELSNPAQVMSAIGTIQIGGGTDIYAGLKAMADVLPGDPAKVKHVILLTDGGADPTGIPELVQGLYEENGITLSTVGVGNDAAPFLEDLAALAGGRYHFTNDASSIPSIFTEETSIATRAYLVEETFFPTLVNSSPILTGIDTIPRLRGYVASSPKDLAQVILRSDKEDPILATWQYGLGRSVAFTSDATGRWGTDWLNWDGFAAFWVQTVRSTISNSVNSTLEMSVVLEGEQARVTLDARTPSGDFVNGYDVQGNIVAPDGGTRSITFQQVAPGQYEAVFTPTQQGVYLFRLSGTSGTEAADSFSETKGWTLSYSPEYASLESDPDLLLRLIAVAGGKVLSSNPADAFTHDLRATHASLPLWPWLILLAAILLPFDIAVRRLILTRQDWARIRSWFGETLLRRPISEPAPRPSPQMQALFKAKDRARVDAPASSPPLVETSVSQPLAQPLEQADEPKPEPILQKPAPPPAQADTTASLLAHKKAQRKKRT